MMQRLSSVLLLSFVIAGCSDSGPQGQIVTVTGKVIDAWRLPVGGAVVLIAGNRTTTGNDGTFSVPNVTTPYDVAVGIVDPKAATIYQGLTRADPVIQLFLGPTLPQLPTVTVRGTISGASGFPPPSASNTEVVLASPTGIPDVVTAGPPNYDYGHRWLCCTAMTVGAIHVLQRQSSPGTATSYAYGSRTGVSFTSGAVLSGQDVTLAPVASATLSGTLSVPAGYVPGGARVWMVFDSSRASMIPTGANLANGAFSFVAPSIPGVKMVAEGIVNLQPGNGAFCHVWKAGLAPNASGVSLALPAAALLTEPADGITNVSTSTVFSWTQSAGGIHVLTLDGPPDQPHIYVVTAATSARVPDLGAISLGLPRGGVSYSWAVYSINAASVDAAAGSAGYLDGVRPFFVSPSSDGFYCYSFARSFTTAP